MINKIDFEIIADGQKLMRYSNEQIKKTLLKDDICQVFVEYGVPRFLSPDIDFIREEKGGFGKLCDYWNIENYAGIYEEIYLKKKFEEYVNYIVIASHNNGVIAIKDKKEVVFVDYESLSELYVNKNIEDFLFCIVLYNKMVVNVMEEHPTCEYYVEVLSQGEIDTLKEGIKRIDENAIKNDAFWSLVIDEALEE